MSRTTIKEIAKECGVSLSTVSLVLNNNPRISASTREKVLASVEKHQYQPNAFARSLASRSSHALSVVVPHLNHVFADVYFGEIVSGIYDRASELGYKVLLDVANQRFIGQQEYVRLLKSRRVDGMLFIGSSIYDDYLYPFEDGSYPFLLVNHYFPNHPLNYIVADYKSAAQLAADHLLDLGHKKIGIISATNTHTIVDFQTEFVERCAKRNVPEEDLPWADGWFSEQGGYEAAQWLLERYPDLTAIMTANDKMAIGAMRYVHTRKLQVPNDISIMGMDDIPAAQFTTPRLTTIRQDIYRMGQSAVDGMLALVKKEQSTWQKTTPVTLQVRESTGPAPKK